MKMMIMITKTNFVPLLVTLLGCSIVFGGLAQEQTQTLNTAGARPWIPGGAGQQGQPQAGGAQQGQGQGQSEVETGEGQGDEDKNSEKAPAGTLTDSKSLVLVADKVQIDVMNGLPPSSEPLIVHCKSKNDDLGNHSLTRWGYFYWRFRPSFWSDTLYWCNWWWGKNYAKFDVYNDKKDEDKCFVKDLPNQEKLTNVCHWQARFDGFYWTKYIGIAEHQTDPKWEKRYDWNKEYTS